MAALGKATAHCPRCGGPIEVELTSMQKTSGPVVVTYDSEALDRTIAQHAEVCG